MDPKPKQEDLPTKGQDAEFIKQLEASGIPLEAFRDYSN